jgi:hypothetical protein
MRMIHIRYCPPLSAMMKFRMRANSAAAEAEIGIGFGRRCSPDYRRQALKRRQARRTCRPDLSPVSPHFLQAGKGLARFNPRGVPKIRHKFLPPLGNPSWQKPCQIPVTV